MLQAKSIEVGPDGRTWTITLNPDYKWSNGQPITAADWVYSWKRILDPKLGERGRLDFYDVENAEDYNKGKVTDVSQVGIKATGENTFQVVTAKPAPQFRAMLALPYFTPVPQGGGREVGDKWIAPENILSNGPYKLVRPGNESRSSWRRIPITAARSQPSAHRDDDRLRRSVTAQLRAYEAGEVDFATCVPPRTSRVLKDATLPRS